METKDTSKGFSFSSESDKIISAFIKFQSELGYAK
jgi:hypothetical protein